MIFSLSYIIVTLRVGNNIAAVHLHEVRLHKKPCLAGAGAADHKDIFIPCVLRLLRAAVHRQPFRLREQHIVLKNRVDVGLYIFGFAP